MMLSFTRRLFAANPQPRCSTKVRLQLGQLELKIAPATYTVTNTNDSGAGSLRQAIDDADNDSIADIIDFKSSVFGNGATITLASEITITDSFPLTILPDFSKVVPVVIDADLSGRALTINAAGAISITGLEFRNGYVSGADVQGGGILIVDGSVTLNSCIVLDCELAGSTAASGGGIALAAGTLTLNHCYLSDNTANAGDASLGGGLYVGDATATLSQTGLQKNSVNVYNGYGAGIAVETSGVLTMTEGGLRGHPAALLGGGIWSEGQLTLTRTYVINCTATLAGGGIYQKDGAIVMNESTIDSNFAETGGGGGMAAIEVDERIMIANSTISNNTAAYGGGLSFESCEIPPAIVNSTIAFNTVETLEDERGGGGIYSYQGEGNEPLIYDCTIAYNTAPLDTPGGGIRGDESTGFTLRNTMVAKNIADPTDGPDISTDATITANYSLWEDNTGFPTPSGINNQDGKDPGLPGDLMYFGGPTRTLATDGSGEGIDAGDPTLDGLTASINNTDTSIAVNSTLLFTPGLYITIEAEIMLVTGISSATVITVTRGQYDTTAVSHSSKVEVDLAYDQRLPVFDRVIEYTSNQVDIGAYELHRLPMVAYSYFVLDLTTELKSASRVTGLIVMFDQPVEFKTNAVAAISVEQYSDPYTKGSVTITTSDDGSTGKVGFLFDDTVTFAPDGSLIDGKYRVTILAPYVHAPGDSKRTLDGDGDGNAEGSPTDDVEVLLHRFFGDIDFDGDVDVSDFAQFRAAFGTGSDLRFDVDGDDDVDVTDYAAFRDHFGLSV